MKNRIFKMINFLIDQLEINGVLTKEYKKWFLNNEYSMNDWLIHNFFQNENEYRMYDKEDYYLGRMESIDKYTVFKNKNEIAIYLCEGFISCFDSLKENLENDFFNFINEFEKEDNK